MAEQDTTPTPEMSTCEPWGFPAPGVLEVGALTCRPWQLGDVAQLVRVVAGSLDHLRPWMPWAEGYDAAAAEEFVAGHSAQPGELTSDAVLGIFDADGTILGGTGMHSRNGPGVAEIGYWLAQPATGRGVMTRAAAAVTEACMELPGILGVEIHHDRDNARSGAVARRLGYRLLGEWPRDPGAGGESGVECRWRLDPDQWAGCEAGRILAQARAAQGTGEVTRSRS